MAKFAILYTCIYYNRPMNLIKWSPNQILAGWFIAIIRLLKLINIWKFCPSRWISPLNICFWYFSHTLHIYYNPQMNPYNLQQNLSDWLIYTFSTILPVRNIHIFKYMLFTSFFKTLFKTQNLPHHKHFKSLGRDVRYWRGQRNKQTFKWTNAQTWFN